MKHKKARKDGTNMPFFPEPAAFNGPGDSLRNNQNRLGFVATIEDVDIRIEDMDDLQNPEEAEYTVPVVPYLPTLWVGVASASLCLPPTSYEVPLQYFYLPPEEDVYIYALPIGLGNPTDFPGLAGKCLPSVPQSAWIVAQQNGTYQIEYPPEGSFPSATVLYAQSPVDVSDENPVRIIFTTKFKPSKQGDPNAGHGPGFFDVNGNGWAIQFSNGATTLVGVASGVITGPIDVGGAFPQDDNFHQYGLQILYEGLDKAGLHNYRFEVFVDNPKKPFIKKAKDRKAGQRPVGLYPGYLNTEGSVTLSSWSWTHGLLPICGWQASLQSSLIGLGPAARFFVFSVGPSTVISCRDIYPENTLTNQIAYLSKTINLLQGAYN